MSFLSFKCMHKKLSEIKEDGRQYCLLCNKAFAPPCPHLWAEHSERNICNSLSGKVTGIVNILRCKRCGDLKEFRTSV